MRTITKLLLVPYLYLSYILIRTNADIMLSKRVVEIESVTVCPDNNKLESPARNLKFYWLNRTHRALSYDVTFKRPLDVNVGANAVIERWGNAGWMQIPFMPFQPDVCNTMKQYFKDVWVPFNEALGVKNPDKCPVPPGNYSLKDYVLPVSDINVPIWKGKLRFSMTFQLTKTRQTIFCMLYLLNIKEVV